MNIIKRITTYYRDADYYRQLYKIGVPIAFQQFAFSLLGMLGNIMVGQRGDIALAATTAAGQVYFLLNLFLFGVASGSAMVTAQLWGKKDVLSIRKVLGLCLLMNLVLSGMFLMFSEIGSTTILSFYSSDPEVVVLGSHYLRILAVSFLFFSISFSFGLVLRSTGNVKLPVIISVASLGVNILLSYGLIFGKMGLPEMGILGAAWAVVISRILECVLLITIIYASRLSVAATIKEMLSFDRSFFTRVMKPVLPVILNEILWSLGITAYNAVYGHIGTGALAAVNILSTVDNIALVLFMGLSNATSVTVGNRIGAGDQEGAYKFGGRTLGLGIFLALLVGTAVFLVRNPVISLYKVSTEAADSAYYLLTIHALFLWIRSTNMTIIVGLLRAGGDTRFSLVLDGFIIWILGVPMALLGAFVFHFPVQWVYLMVMSEEVTKWILGLWRYFTRGWIHDLTHLRDMTI